MVKKYGLQLFLWVSVHLTLKSCQVLYLSSHILQNLAHWKKCGPQLKVRKNCFKIELEALES